MNDKSHRLYPQRPFVAVATVVFKGSSVLMVARGSEPRLGEWGLPGGCQEINETIYEAASREVLEETGVEADVMGLVDVVDSIHSDADGRTRLHYTIVELWAEWRQGKPSAGSDAGDAAWFTLDEAVGAVRWQKTAEIIRRAAALRREWKP